MASEEQYLDELLKSMTDTNSRTMEETMRELNLRKEAEPTLEALVEDAVTEPEAEPLIEDVLTEAVSYAVDEAAGVAEQEKPEAEPLMEDTESFAAHRDDMDFEDPEIASDLADIHAMLKMAEQSSLDDNNAEEMRALLQGIEDTGASEPPKKHKKEKRRGKRKGFWKRKKDQAEQPEEPFEDVASGIPEELFGDADAAAWTDALRDVEQEQIGTNFSDADVDALKGALRDEEQEQPEELFDGAVSGIPDELLHGTEPELSDDFLREIEGELPETQAQAETPVKEKKPGFFSRIMKFLFEEADDEPETSAGEQPDTGDAMEKPEENATGENAQILEELDSEKKKKEKKGKKGKKGKQTSGEEPEGEEAAESKDTDKKAGKKREKKEKPPKKEKPVLKKEPAILSTRVRLGLIAFGATFIAAILFLSIFLPEHTDRIKAREAYYQGDYETAYQELNNKRLSASDALIYHRSETILSLQKKLTSYENRMALGQQAEALDALFRGVELYDQLIVEDTYGVAEELTGIYQSICGILEGDYGVSAQEAAEINTYDAQAYTRKLYSLINGTEFEMSHEEPQTDAEREPQEEPDGTPEPLQDVLEAEEELF